MQGEKDRRQRGQDRKRAGWAGTGGRGGEGGKRYGEQGAKGTGEMRLVESRGARTGWTKGTGGGVGGGKEHRGQGAQGAERGNGIEGGRSIQTQHCLPYQDCSDFLSIQHQPAQPLHMVQDGKFFL